MSLGGSGAGGALDRLVSSQQAEAGRLGRREQGEDARLRAEAAEQFEGMLIQQLWKTLRQTVSKGGALGGSGPGSEIYLQMIDQAMAGQIARDGGVGLRATLLEAMGVPPEAGRIGEEGIELGSAAGDRGASQAAQGVELAEAGRSRPPLGPIVGDERPGATGRLQAAARELVTPENAGRWGRHGELRVEELSSPYASEVAGGVARFNVRDAAGFQGYYKCNLFAFELARRAGFQVPLMARTRGWGYPHPDSVAADAADGDLRRDWGRVATGTGVEAINSRIDSGQGAYLITGSGHGENVGHMGIIERIHRIDYAENGEVARVVFDGWEARSDGARHLVQRTWNVYGNPGGNLARNGLSRIELIELQRPAAGQAQELPLSNRAGVSIRDIGTNSQDAAQALRLPPVEAEP